jgi:hypothetical protein
MAMRDLSDDQMQFIYDRVMKRVQWPFITREFIQKWEGYKETLESHAKGAVESLRSKYKSRKTTWTPGPGSPDVYLVSRLHPKLDLHSLHPSISLMYIQHHLSDQVHLICLTHHIDFLSLCYSFQTIDFVHRSCCSLDEFKWVRSTQH